MDHFIVIKVRKVPKKSVLDKPVIRIGIVVNYLLRLGRTVGTVGCGVISKKESNCFYKLVCFLCGKDDRNVLMRLIICSKHCNASVTSSNIFG